ncbi:MAG: tetratricopeptide repeat protein [Pedosphaera sp.]|nr:tetratricopeptide repeat protein [Pedosphaera sp.]
MNDRGEVLLPLLPAHHAAGTAESQLNVSLRLYQAGDFEASIAPARRALVIKSDFPEAYNNIAASFASLRKWDEAIQSAREALRLKPDFQLARNNLVWAEGEKQKMLRGSNSSPSKAS